MGTKCCTTGEELKKTERYLTCYEIKYDRKEAARVYVSKMAKGCWFGIYKG